MKNKFIILLVLCSMTTVAQDCDKEKLKTLPGNWLPQPADEVLTGSPRPAAADAAGAKNVFNQIGKLFQQHYKPVGADVYNYLTHNITPGSSVYGNWYIYTISNFMFYCSNGKKARNSEGVSSAVHVNPNGLLNTKFSEILVYNESGEVSSEVTNTCGFNSLSSKECKEKKLPDLSNGYHSFESGNDYYVWITYEGKLPYRYVNRKEFLEKQVAISEAKLKELNIFYSSKGWKEQFEMFPQYKEKMLEDKKKHLVGYENPLQAYRQDMKKDAAWLNEIAVVKYVSIREPTTNAHQYSRYDFTTVDDPYMVVPIMPNPDYYNKKLPKWAPQLIVINVSRIDGVTPQNVRKVVEENTDFFKGLLVNNE
ncbi:MAG: hypothetical protein KIT62_07290 [Cyclobacteriaceae bacterium]|nr:hypothetical protein [Cyclobacteriaceae bacterium]